MDEIRNIKRIIEEAENIVFFGGAGVSTASGIPDFRSSGGLYSSEDIYEVRPETILSHDFLMQYPDRFYDYYKNNMLYPEAKPNGAHYALAELERRGKLKAVVTQNIDGLHQKAGSRNVIELHGTVLKNYCVRCDKKYETAFIESADGTPRCSCGGFVRPDVVMYGEALPMDAFYRAEEAIAEADVLIVGGTSLTVNPAASLVSCYEGRHLIIINMSPTPYDDYAEYVVRDHIAEVLESMID